MNWFLVLIGLVGMLGLGYGAYRASQNPIFWINLVKNIVNFFLPDILKMFKNRPKTEEEWKEWRYLSSLKPREMTPKERSRYRELKKLNDEFKGEN